MRWKPAGRLWRDRDFINFWGAQSISQVGSGISQIALPFVAVVTLDASAFAVAALATVEFLPFLLFALPAGVWVDRLRRRPIMIVADVARGLALASVAVTAALGVLTIAQLFVVGFVVGIFTVFFDVAYQSYLPSLVARENLVEGNSKLEFSRSAAGVGGPGVGGGLVTLLTAPYAVLADTISFFASAWLLVRIRKPEAAPEPGEAPGMWRELREGLRYLLGDPRWRSVSAYVGTFNFFSNVMFSIFIVYAVRELGLSAFAIGVIFALANLGSVLAAVIASRTGTRFGIGRTMIIGGLFGGLPMLLIPLAPKSFPEPFIVASQTLVALGIVLYNVTAISYFQAVVPERMLGRFNATRRWIVWGTIPLGNLTGGFLAETIGLRETLFVGAIGCILPVLFLLVAPVRSIDRLPEQPLPDEELIPVPPGGQTVA